MVTCSNCEEYIGLGRTLCGSCTNRLFEEGFIRAVRKMDKDSVDKE